MVKCQVVVVFLISEIHNRKYVNYVRHIPTNFLWYLQPQVYEAEVQVKETFLYCLHFVPCELLVYGDQK